ncbi:hypothetical protein PIB30_010776 [Stylosanthes scabra]|uniref:Uncharacterized protein n=1 Tax=Stylosanthes scabra TaxID=79078 RepID=A0ABU6Z436_9FABA|nr:hypothetical protein [Stylosanthes scabra]
MDPSRLKETLGQNSDIFNQRKTRVGVKATVLGKLDNRESRNESIQMVPEDSSTSSIVITREKKPSTLILMGFFGDVDQRIRAF